MAKAQPIVDLLDWQKRYIDDPSRFKLVVACAQSGKSFATSLEFVLRALRKKKGLGILLSASERQSVELMEKVKVHCQAMNAVVDYEDGFFEQTEIAQHSARFPNGARIIALPANPDTARGYSGDVFLDEFALHRDSKSIWAAMMTRATRGYDVRVASTIKGTNNKFYELVKSLGMHEGGRPESQPVKKAGWSGHWVDIYMCREQGLKVDIEGLREAIGDEDIWLQDYCNVAISDASQYIADELWTACESDEASLEWDGTFRFGLCAGFDVARSRDLSVITIVEPVADLVVVRGLILMNRMKFSDQMARAREVASVIQEGGGRFAIDSTGIGAQMAETLRDEFPCVEAVNFATRADTGALDEKQQAITEPVKNRMAGELKRRVEDRLLRVPESPMLRRSVRAVKKYVGPTGAVRLDAARTESGHADEFWSLALAVSAAAGPRNYVPASEGGLFGRPVMAGVMEREF